MELSLNDRAMSFGSRCGSPGKDRDLMHAAWDVDEIAEAYAAFEERFSTVRPRTGEAFFVASTQLVHEWRRFAFLDPVLPEALLPPGWIGWRAKALYDD